MPSLLTLYSLQKVAHAPHQVNAGLTDPCAYKRSLASNKTHDNVIKWKHFPRYWPFVRGIHRSPVNSPHKGQWRGALMFSLIYAWINGWVNNGEAGDLRRHCAHYGVTVMHLFSTDTLWDPQNWLNHIFVVNMILYIFPQC